MYKVTADRLPELERRVNRIAKKLAKYNLSCSFEVVGIAPETVTCYAIDPVSRMCVKTGTAVLDVVSYAFDMDTLKVGEWTPIAVIEHSAIRKLGAEHNMVHAINGAELLSEWWDIPANCNHCKADRVRNTTVMLMDVDGSYKQVGSTCVKEFTGIDAMDVISLYSSIEDIYEEEPRYEGEHIPRLYAETVNYLAHCIGLITKCGYRKEQGNSTKVEGWELAVQNEASPENMNKANEIVAFYSNMDTEELDSFGLNVRAAITAEYSKCSGFVAYAPVAYEKLKADIAAKAARDASKGVSQWVGEIGKRITVSVELVRSAGFGTDYGYTFIHIFKDGAGNLYKWSTQKHIEAGACVLTGTVKDHNEYEGEKQTVVTRCKIS